MIKSKTRAIPQSNAISFKSLNSSCPYQLLQTHSSLTNVQHSYIPEDFHVVRTHCDLIKKIVLIDPSNMPTKKLEVIECEILELFKKALDSASLGHDEITNIICPLRLWDCSTNTNN
ncbi:MAG: hypothetical protein WBF33_07685 [Candidatus Nitrosopolaris sp.]|jgi:hypothetical protein